MGNVLVIGAQGMVGMATVELLEKSGISTFTYDRPAVSEDQIKTRAQRAKNYALLKEKSESLDNTQARWLLGDQDLSKNTPSKTVGDIATAFTQGVDTLVVTAGLPRKGSETRADLLKKNIDIFMNYAKQISDAYVATLTSDAKSRFPVIIIAGNPMDAMTETLGKSVSLELARLKKKHPEHDAQIQTAIDKLPSKIIGQGGILDGARAAKAISDILKIPLNDIISVPVLGTHNEKMVVDFDNIIIRYQDKEIRLKDDPFASISLDEECKSKITAATRDGGKAVIAQNNKIIGEDQSAVFATGAAILPMVKASLSEKGTALAAAIYNPHSKAVMGEVIHLSRDGAQIQTVPISNGTGVGLKIAEAGAKEDSETVLGAIRNRAKSKSVEK